MRLIGQVPKEAAARTFSDFLYAQGIANRLELQQGENWGVWVEEEDKLSGAATLLAEFNQNPSDPRFREGAKAATARRAQSEKEQKAFERRVRGSRHLFKPIAGYGFGPVTFVLITVSVIVFFLSRFGAAQEPVMGLHITRFWQEGMQILWLPNLPEVSHGQVWRLVTPIFIHMGVLHILFNMLWLLDLGSMIEGRQGPLVLIALVFVTAVASNLAQYHFGGSPAFGGMSGVVYGLFGYVWLRANSDPASGLFLRPTTVTLMMVWFFACLVGIIPNVANWTHAVGLMLGMAWGYLSALIAARKH